MIYVYITTSEGFHKVILNSSEISAKFAKSFFLDIGNN